MISVCKSYEFAAAHHLPNHNGKCRSVHGHNYLLEVELAGEPREWDVDRPRSSEGMVVDFATLDAVVKPLLAHPDGLDHSDLNMLLDAEYLPPTAESLVRFFRDCLEAWVDTNNAEAAPDDPTVLTLERIRVWETPKAYAEWKR